MNPTISAQRTCENNQRLPIRRRNEWGARRSYTDENPINFPATTLFLHISVTNPTSYSSNDRHAQAIENIGISRFPNTGISYNAGIMPNGAIYEFQPLGRRGAHTVNDFNRSSCTTTGCPGRGGGLKTPSGSNNLNYSARAIVLCQNTGNTVTSAQVHAIAKTAAAWKRCGYVARGARWHGHRCVSSKSCPGNLAWAKMAEINRLTESYTVNGLGGTTPPVTSGDLVTTQTEFNTFMNNWCHSAAVATRAYMDKVNAAVLAGTAMPALPNPSLERAGIQLGVMVALWPVVGRHTVKTATTPGKVAPNTHQIFGEMHNLYAQQAARYSDIVERQKLILAEASDDEAVPVNLDAAQIEALATFIAAKTPDAGDELRKVLGSLDETPVIPGPEPTEPVNP